jgi:superfamily I DNA/RNA helicase
MHELVAALNNQQRWDNFPGRYAYLVIYPQGKANRLPDMFDESTIATHQHMNQLHSRLVNALEKRGQGCLGEKLTRDVVKTIIDQLKNRSFQVQKVDTEQDVANDLQKIEVLTRQQFASLKGLFQLPNVAVIGPAGSGKTILAMWRLKSLIDAGQNAVYVCYNRALADVLRLRNPDYQEYIWNVDRLFSRFCPEQRPTQELNEYYREALPGLVMDRADSLDHFDAIIIDEGQDLSESQIIALHDLLKTGAVWAFFADWKQDLYSAGNGNPIGAEVIFHLYHNCRNTIKINDTSNNFLDSNVESMPGMPEGEVPVVQYSGSQVTAAWELAKQWAREGSIAILSPFRYENSSMHGQLKGHGLILSQDVQDLGKANTVVFSTIKSFKGLEASCVIVIDIDIPDHNPAFSMDDLYVATTRATARLALISDRKNVIKSYENKIK